MKAQLPALFRDACGENATFGELLALRLIAEAANGSTKALSIVLDRTEGKAATSIKLSEDNENAIVLRVR